MSMDMYLNFLDLVNLTSPQMKIMDLSGLWGSQNVKQQSIYELEWSRLEHETKHQLQYYWFFFYLILNRGRFSQLPSSFLFFVLHCSALCSVLMFLFLLKNGKLLLCCPFMTSFFVKTPHCKLGNIESRQKLIWLRLIV